MNDDSLFNLIECVCDLLDQAGVDYAITGSVASTAYAQPCFSWDVDVCMQASATKLGMFLSALPSRFYHDDDAIREASAQHSMYNIIDNQTGLKVDLSFLPDKGYLGGILARRKKVPYGREGKMFWMVSPEDTILMKLLWRRDTRSDKQWENALGVVRTVGVRLDWTYLHHWADQSNLRGDLDRLKNEAGI